MKTAKKLLAVLLCFSLLMLSISICAQAARDSSSDTFISIGSYQDLKNFRDRVNSGETNLCAELTTDITIPTDSLGNYEKWLPIENYKGVFDGKGHTITGITIDPNSPDLINSTINNVTYQQSFGQLRQRLGGFHGTLSAGHYDYESGIGFFGSICENGYVKGIILDDCNIIGYQFVGAIVGENNGWIDKCLVNNSTIRGSLNVGGICGQCNSAYGYDINVSPYDYDALVSMGAITNCSTNSGTNVIGSNEVGGICGGDDYGVFEHCVNYAAVSTDGSAGMTGGIVGELIGLVYDCANFGAVSCKNSGAGGICGTAGEAALIENSFNAGHIAGVTCVGGIAGYVSQSWDLLPEYYSSKLIVNCYNDGVIQGDNRIGGIVGFMDCDEHNVGYYYQTGARENLHITANTIWNCFNHGDTIGGSKAGGIAGENSGIIQNCYSCKGMYLIGQNNAGATVTDCYYCNSAIDQDNANNTSVFLFDPGIMQTNINGNNISLKDALNTWVVSEPLFMHKSYAFKMERNIKMWNDGFCGLNCGSTDPLPAFETGITFPSEDPNLPVPDPSMVITDGVGIPGHDVTVKVKVNDNPGIIGTRILIGYDSSALTLVSVSDCNLLGYGNSLMSNSLSANPYIIIWDDPLANSDYCNDGELATLTFHVNENTTADTTALTLTCDNSSTFNCSLDPVSFRTENGEITIVSYISGDVDNDCAVTLRDAVYMRRALAGWVGYEVNESAADVNGDGVFSLLDVTVTRRYLAGWDLSEYDYPIGNI